MRRFLLALAAMYAMPALAADLPAPVFKAVPTAVLSGPGGLYLGAFTGGGMTTERFDFVTIPGSGNLKPSGFQGGAKIGYGLWISPSLMIGLEADGAIDLGRTQANACGVAAVCSSKNSWLFTQRAVFGWAMGSGLRAAGASTPDQWPVPLNLPTNFSAAKIVPYITAGVAERRIEAEAMDLGKGKEWLVGAVGGVGVKVPISASISFDVSYLYVNYNKNFIPASTPAGIFQPEFKATSEHIGRVALTYGW